MADVVSAKTLVFCDLSRGCFVTGRYSPEKSQVPLGQFFSQDLIQLEIYPLILRPFSVPTQDPFQQVDVSALACTFAIFNSTGSTVLASTSSFTSDTEAGTLTGSIDCNTVPMAAAVTTDPTQILIEVRFSGTFGSKNVRASGNATLVRKQFNTTGSPTPLAGAVYLTRDELLNMFVPREMQAGDSISWKSSDGTKRVLEYLDNTGVLRQDAIS